MVRWANNERGAVLPMVGICLVLIILGVAFAVDTGRTALTAAESRTVADLAALDSARSLDGRAASAQFSTIQHAAQRSAARNGAAAGDHLAVYLGVADGTRSDGTVEYRRLNLASATDANTVPNAVEVVAGAEVPFYFAEGSAAPRRSAVAIMAGASNGTAKISIETAVANLNTELSVLNGLLSALGTSVKLNGVSYSGLASADVSLLGLLARLDVPTGMIDDVLNTTYSLSEVLGALVAELGSNPALAVLQQIALASTSECLNAGMANQSGSCIRPGDFVNGELDGLPLDGIDVSALEFVRAMLMSGTIGRTLNLALEADLQGVAVTAVQAEITAPPVFAVGGVGATASSAQVTLRVTPSALPASSPPLLSLPIFAVAGGGSATITDLVCDGGEVPSSITHNAKTRGARVGIGILTKGTPPNPITDQVAFSALVDINILVQVGFDARLDLKAAESTVNSIVVRPVLAGSPPKLTYPGVPTPVGFGAAASTISGASSSTLKAALEVKPRSNLDLLEWILNPILNVLDTVVSNVVVPTLDPIVTGLLVPVLGALGATVGSASIAISDGACSARTPQLVLIR